MIVNEPSLKDAVTILNKLKKSYEEFYNLKINSNVIKYLVDLCDKYLPNSYNPDKSIDILDTSLSKIALEGKKRILTKEDVYEVISKRCNISLVSDENLDKVRAVLSDKYSEVLADNVVKMFKCRDKSKYMVFSGSDDKRRAPFDIGKCLGVNVIDIDCALYNDEYSLNKFVSTNYLYNKISENPFSLVVFDNYNKRGRVLDNIIRMMKDKGYIENSMNERLYLDKAVMFLIDEEVNNKVGFAAS